MLSVMLLSYGNLQWGGHTRPGLNLIYFHGNNSVYYYYVPETTRPEFKSRNIATLSNVGIPGLFMYRVDQEQIIEPSSNVIGK